MKACKMSKEDYKKLLKSISKRKYECEKCGRMSDKKKDLCKPVKRNKKE